MAEAPRKSPALSLKTSTQNSIKRFVLMGHGYGLTKMAQTLQKAGHKIVGILTHPKEEHAKDESVHEQQNKLGVYGSVFELAQQHDIPLREEKNINNVECTTWIQSLKPDYLISSGLRSIIRKEFLKSFPENCVLNVHGAPLPNYRGGATDSWMILNEEKEIFGVCHVVDEGIDTGAIVSRMPYTIPEKARPIDIYKSRVAIYGDLVLQACQNLENPSLTLKPQDPSEGFTLPKLKTDLDGHINWHNEATLIERHIRAFGTPYAGAFTYLRTHRVRIIDGYVENNQNKSFHPNTIGIVVGQTSDGGWRIATGEGIYVISEGYIEPIKDVITPKIRPAVRFQSKTRREILEELKK